MAVGFKTGGRDFKKGNKCAPGGKKLPADLKESREFTKQEFERVTNMLLELSVVQLNTICRSQKIRVLDSLVANILYRGIVEGDHVRLNFFLDRFIGKPKERIDVTGKIEHEHKLEGVREHVDRVIERRRKETHLLKGSS